MCVYILVAKLTNSITATFHWWNKQMQSDMRTILQYMYNNPALFYVEMTNSGFFSFKDHWIKLDWKFKKTLHKVWNWSCSIRSSMLLLLLTWILELVFFFQSNNRCRCFFIIIIIGYDRLYQTTVYYALALDYALYSWMPVYVFILIIRGLIRYSDFNFKIYNNNNNKNHQLNLL